MIEVKVVFDGESIRINNKRVDLYGGSEGCVCYSVGSIGFHTLEQAIKYCMEN